MKIAIIGTSPIMLLKAATLLKKNNDVTIFDVSKKIGGAWSYTRVNNKLIPAQTNVVVPNTKREEKSIKKINEYMNKKFNIKISKISNFFLNHNFKPKFIYYYNFIPFFNYIRKKNFNFKCEKINTFNIKKKQLYIKNKKFNKIYLSYFSGVKSVNVENKKIKIDYKPIRSKHIIFLLKKTKKSLFYMDKFDEVFDRMFMLKSNGSKFMIARISKKYKKKKINNLIKDTKFDFLKKKNIKSIKLLYYLNHFRNMSQIKKLIELKKFKQVNIVDTLQFVNSFNKLKLL